MRFLAFFIAFLINAFGVLLLILELKGFRQGNENNKIIAIILFLFFCIPCYMLFFSIQKELYKKKQKNNKQY